MEQNILFNKYFYSIPALLVSVLVSCINYAHAEQQYPKQLTANQAMQYFSRYPKIEMKKPIPSFDFMIKGNDIERYCFLCGTPTGYGDVKYDMINDNICFDWNYVSFPPSGCFRFVQTGPGSFELQNKNGEAVYVWGSLEKVVIKKAAPFKEIFERPILIDLDDLKPSKEKIHTVLLQAMKNKGWKIVKDTPESIVGTLEQSGSTYQVMAKIRGTWVAVGYVQGFAPSHERWLYNIKQQLMVQISR